MSLRRFRSADASDDLLDHRQRIGLTVLCLLAVSIGCGLLAHQILSGSSTSAWQAGIWALGAIGGGTLGLILTGRWLGQTLAEESGLVSRLVLAISCWVGAWVGLVVVAPLSELIGSAFPRDGGLQVIMWASFLPLLMLDLRQLLSAKRRQRIALGPALLTGIVACLLALVLGGDPVLALGIAAGITLTAQVASPFVPSRRRRGGDPFAAVPVAAKVVPSEHRAVATAEAGAATPTPAAPPGPVAGNVSPRSRTIALILAVGPGAVGHLRAAAILRGKGLDGTALPDHRRRVRHRTTD